ncbi:hypothetical protein TRFO_29739 [Tritrichomonas foetus]|uniref:Uncharacterized protein n=1 Tax=Tritrichomonas foetus TaxID=1144522 RepID=A0A1J4JZR1_9EUKA|nr:hypothetical protein TRFO_29739 [Tritrichomonas foetus]|eukprot:OHT02982.1 hypothetical protein TRFO_29739 [Tritrichomonas foetus]
MQVIDYKSDSNHNGSTNFTKAMEIRKFTQSQHEFSDTDSDFYKNLHDLLMSGDYKDILCFIELMKEKILNNSLLYKNLIDYNIPKLMASLIIKNENENTSSVLLNLAILLITSYKNHDLIKEFVDENILEKLNLLILLDDENFVEIISAISILNENSIKARNFFLQNLDFSIVYYRCSAENVITSRYTYEFVTSFCKFALADKYCDIILDIFVNGIQSQHLYALDVIFEGILQISFIQETFWYPIFMKKQGEKQLVHYLQLNDEFNEINIYLVKDVILRIIQRAVETGNNLSISILNAVLDYSLKIEQFLNLDKTEHFFISSLETISNILCIMIDESQMNQSFLEQECNKIIDILFMISMIGNFNSKNNAAKCLSALFLKGNDSNVNHLLQKKFIDYIVPLLDSDKSDFILSHIISLIKIIEISISHNYIGHIVDNLHQSGFFDLTEFLLSHSDSLIQEKVSYLLQIIEKEQHFILK